MSGITVWENEKDTVSEDEQSFPVWTEERCEELWERVEGVRHKLTRILNPAKLTPYLRQCKVIDEQDEDEVLNSTQYPLRVNKAGRLLDILRTQGHRGLQAFMESLEFYHPQQYTQLTGEQPTQRCSLILDEEGPEGLTQFLLLEVRKLREQLKNSRLCERRLTQQCRAAEEERTCAERKAQELLRDKQQVQRLRQDWESANRELGMLKDRHLEQAVKYSKALEEQGKASTRERELLRQVEELKSRLMAAEKAMGSLENTTPVKTHRVQSKGVSGSPAALPQKPLLRAESGGTETQERKALMDILQQDRREASEQRQELCDIITRLQGELQSAEEQRDKLLSQCEQLQLNLKALHLDWETEQKRSLSYFNQIMELEKERDQALRSRDSLQLEYTDCLLDKNRLRKCIADLEADLDQQQRALEKERVKNQEQKEQNNHCLSCSHLSLCSEDQCYDPCCSLGLDLSPRASSSQQLLKKAPSRGQTQENSEDSNSEENLLILSSEVNEKEINRLSTFPFPPCMNSINRRFHTEFDLDSWGSDDNDNVTGVQTQPCLWDSWNSLHSQPFPPDLVNTPVLSSQLSSQSLPSPCTSPKPGKASLADDITIVGGNLTGIFVSHVRSGSPAEQCGLKEGSELLELEQVLSSGGSVLLGQCTAEVAHFSLQWWTEPQSLKHRTNPESYAQLCSQLSSPTFMGADSFYVRVNLNMEPHGDSPSLSLSCDDIIHVTDTRYHGKYHWHCSVVDPNTVKPLQTGTMPNYNRAQQLLLLKLRKIALQENHFTKKMFHRKSPDRVRLVKAVDPHSRGSGSTQQVIYTLSKRHEEHLIPYSLVQPVEVQTKRPVIFTPSLLSHGLIQRLLQLTRSDLTFDTCAPEAVQASERQDKNWLLINSCSSKQTLGIRLKSIQNVIEQDKHCLLELGVSNVEGLIRQGIYPIVIHVRRKNKKHKKLRKFFPHCGENNVMEDECQAEELQLETLPLLFYTLEPSSWSCTDELLAAICDIIHRQQRAVAWVELDRLQ
ncbi:caspase recruitment domain-containing protein 10 isoform X2 [Cynoglossus semilaevis]|uniref:caspase recruitment domain-containing protein 10 isoform X2 n=1 Tax=Cynoglossus semilaevis TaxID=244447 RepID=UPI00049852B9|nr:caspase recruitment domain-containing protein 10 isoform X2 [Cynoglossus semilaevis]